MAKNSQKCVAKHTLSYCRNEQKTLILPTTIKTTQSFLYLKKLIPIESRTL